MFFETQGKTKAITFSYDDGTVQDIRLIELLNKYNLKCTFNLNSELLSTPNILIRDNKRINHYKIHKNDVKYVYEGHEIAVHTLTHPNLTKCEDDEVIRQVELDRQNLSELAGYDVVGMAYPCGGDCYDDRVASLILNNTPIRYARTTDSHHTFAIPENFMKWHPTCDQRDDKLFELAEEFIAAEPTEDMLFYVWGHSFELDKPICDWNRFERFCELISHRREITYMTNGEVYNYITKKRAESND
jgi:peptidoglycan/xylan/chitin deacetylase (PgdA/CDA1 family)